MSKIVVFCSLKLLLRQDKGSKMNFMHKEENMSVWKKELHKSNGER